MPFVGWHQPMEVLVFAVKRAGKAVTVCMAMPPTRTVTLFTVRRFVLLTIRTTAVTLQPQENMVEECSAKERVTPDGASLVRQRAFMEQVLRERLPASMAWVSMGLLPEAMPVALWVPAPEPPVAPFTAYTPPVVLRDTLKVKFMSAAKSVSGQRIRPLNSKYMGTTTISLVCT